MIRSAEAGRLLHVVAVAQTKTVVRNRQRRFRLTSQDRLWRPTWALRNRSAQDRRLVADVQKDVVPDGLCDSHSPTRKRAVVPLL